LVAAELSGAAGPGWTARSRPLISSVRGLAHLGPLAPEQPRLAEALGLVATGHDAINEATEKRLNDVAALWPVVAAVLLLGTAGLALALGLSGTATARTVGLLPLPCRYGLITATRVASV
jgi:hypothetical protein